MPFVCGINFRDTSGYVTDGSNETYCLGEGDSYPTTRGGFTFGWVTINGDAGRDRDSGADRRLAGMNYNTNAASQATFKLDLPNAGTYTIRLAIGDAVFDQSNQYVQVLDNTTPLFTIDQNGNTITGGNFYDANGGTWSAAAWPASNVAKTGQVFSTTTLAIKTGQPSSAGGNTTLAHLYVEEEVSVTDTFANSHSTIVLARYRIVGY